jgi:hypothetical protein
MRSNTGSNTAASAAPFSISTWNRTTGSSPEKSWAGFRDSVDILVGRKRRFDSLSAIYHYPRLAPVEFFDRDEFPWLDAIEAKTDAIRDEFIEVLRTEAGLHAVHFLPVRRSAQPVGGAKQLASVERLPPVQDGPARRGKRGQVPADPGRA